MPDRHLRRAGTARMEGRARSQDLAKRAGIGFRDCRRALGLTQSEASARAGVSQGFWSLLERGGATSASLETLAACAAAIGCRWAGFLEASPGAQLPRDIAHLKGQETIVTFAARGGWRARPEHAIDPRAQRSRSIDVFLERPALHDLAVVELIDLLADGGDVMRGLTDKVMAVRRTATTGTRVGGLLVLRATRRNRGLLLQLRAVVSARFPASSAAWIAALSSADRPMPPDDGLVWVSVDGSRLFPARLG
jgi:transcriptional regulator with XRE-family HTH domain